MAAPPLAGSWSPHPIIYEVPTWPWLVEQSCVAGRPLTLAEVPDAAWDEIVLPGVSIVWLMGVWARSPIGQDLARADPHVRARATAALPDLREADIVGSPYAVRRYEVDSRLGGRHGLAAARTQLARRNARLLVDFVPNHTAIDHHWVSEHPEFYVSGRDEDVVRHPADFVVTPGLTPRVLANARDPHFPPWQDVLQVDSNQPGYRDAVVATLLNIADQSDGVRCDMAILQLDDVVARTWGTRVGEARPQPFWHEVICRVRAQRPDFLFVAEAYWDREAELLAQGFDYSYDKRLAEILLYADAASLRTHLSADPAYQARLVRFLENHDEPRAAGVVGPARNRAASVAVSTVPGALLLHDGQLTGRRTQVPVQLARRPAEPVDQELQRWWRHLLDVLHDDQVRSGTWVQLAVEGWPDNDSFQGLAAWAWQHHRGAERRTAGAHLIAVNLSDQPAAGRIRLAGVEGRHWRLVDRLDGSAYLRDGDAMVGEGLFVELPPWGQHLFRLEDLDELEELEELEEVVERG